MFSNPQFLKLGKDVIKNGRILIVKKMDLMIILELNILGLRLRLMMLLFLMRELILMNLMDLNRPNHTI